MVRSAQVVLATFSMALALKPGKLGEKVWNRVVAEKQDELKRSFNHTAPFSSRIQQRPSI